MDIRHPKKRPIKESVVLENIPILLFSSTFFLNTIC